MNKYFKKWNLRMKVELAQAMPRESGGHSMLYGVYARVMMRQVREEEVCLSLICFEY